MCVVMAVPFPPTASAKQLLLFRVQAVSKQRHNPVLHLLGHLAASEESLYALCKGVLLRRRRNRSSKELRSLQQTHKPSKLHPIRAAILQHFPCDLFSGVEAKCFQRQRQVFNSHSPIPGRIKRIKGCSIELELLYRFVDDTGLNTLLLQHSDELHEGQKLRGTPTFHDELGRFLCFFKA
eukprot:CAMPEP_0175891462 /NCGR_PEP_ID=MMETSP0107_2-20121207/48398_1 /TAXON_ID=195067 ORGANISM="Goniomonas pacifica, Strain CCMP1869" /NCGR_SAMPLE_ID=MMETSP0107_2 /ASSEMBLY_ACC=CAM_ASM_000203 /LENGTH=179 /DNA_ID=CAMNT_0017212343 /DNA_START=254 /DNA_END=793 /DNA_ORIENTATION=+